MKKQVLTIKTPRWAVPLLGPSRYKGAHGGRGSGKSHLFAEMMVESHLINQNRRSVCVREIQRSLNQSVKRLLEIKIEEMNAASYFQIQESCIKSKKGDGLMIFQGMQNHTADSIKSLEGYDCAWVEEAQSLSQRSLDLLRPTIRKPKSELWFTWNPENDFDPVDALLRGPKPPPDSIVVQVNFTDNPFFPDVLKDEMEYDRSRDIDRFNHVWMGEYNKHNDSRVFKNWSVEEFEAPPGTVFKFGADWGYDPDPTVLVRCYVDGRRLFIDYEAYSLKCEIFNIPNLFLTIPESTLYPITADSSRNDTISYMRNNGFNKIFGAVKGPKSVEEGVDWLKSYDIIIHPRCVKTIDEFTNYSYVVDKDTGVVTNKLKDKKNHVIDSIRYAVEGVRRISQKKQVISKDLLVPRLSRWN